MPRRSTKATIEKIAASAPDQTITIQKPKSVVVVDVNAGQAVYIDGVKVSGKERRRHMEDVCHSLKRGDVIELQHWHCAGCQMFEGQVREAGFPAKLSDLPEPRDEYVYPKP